MSTRGFDYTLQDAQAMPVEPIEPEDFDMAWYEDYAAQADDRFAEFLRRPEGIAVWQRVRVAEVFRDGCRDMYHSLRLQLGGLDKTLQYATDVPTYLEPWYGIGTTASAFGAEYDWPEGQAPVVRPLYKSIFDVPENLAPLPFDRSPIMQHTLAMIEYFLEETGGRLPMSWADLQDPLNVATELVDTSAFFLGFVEAPEKVQQMLAAITDVVIAFTEQQSRLIGDALARPGHGFAASRVGTGLGMSADNLVMIAPRTYARFCAANNARIGAQFGGTAIHSCGNWAKWVDAVKQIENLTVVDGAFTPQTDPDFNSAETFRQAFAGTGTIVQARMVGDPDTVLETTRRLWGPGMKLVVVTYVQDPEAERRLYHDLHALAE